MANYNTFLVINSGVVQLCTSSAIKAKKAMSDGSRLEVWNANHLQEAIGADEAHRLSGYIAAEKEYRAAKQRAAEERNGSV